MTLAHFCNCCALAYVPYFITYKYSGLSEYGAFWKCVQAGGIYMFTQLCKMMYLATFFPATDSELSGEYDIMIEFMKSTVDMADLIGLYIIMSRIAGKGDMKVLIAGIGWSSAELFLTRFLPLWFGARGVEFDWKYIQMSFESNINLVQNVTTATLIWLWSRNDLNKSLLPVIQLLMLVCCYKPLIMHAVYQKFLLTTWSFLFSKAVFTCLIGIVALQIYAGLAYCINSY